MFLSKKEIMILKAIASRNDLEIIDKEDSVLLNSYKDEGKYKLFSIKNKTNVIEFYQYFIKELLSVVRRKDLFENIEYDSKWISGVFSDLSSVTKQYGEIIKK